MYTAYPPVEDLHIIEHDPEKAKEYLAAANYNNEEFGILVQAGTNYETAAKVIQAQLMAIGINCVVDAVDNTTLRERDNVREFDGYLCDNLSSIPDADGIAFLLALQSRNAAVNHSFGFLTESGEMILDSSVEAVLDLSEYGSVYLYLHLDVNDASSPVSATLYAVVPETISGDTVLTAPSVYMLEPSEKPMYLIVDKPDNVSFSDTAFARESGARYAEDGMRFENFFPIADNDSEIILNVESHESPVIFDYPFGPSMNSRLIPNDGTVIVERMGKKSCTFQVKEGQRIFPVIFEDSLSDVTVSVSSDSESSARFVVGAGHDSGRGYASRSIHFGESIEIESHQILEYGYLIRTGDLSAIEFTVSVE